VCDRPLSDTGPASSREPSTMAGGDIGAGGDSGVRRATATGDTTAVSRPARLACKTRAVSSKPFLVAMSTMLTGSSKPSCTTTYTPHTPHTHHTHTAHTPHTHTTHTHHTQRHVHCAGNASRPLYAQRRARPIGAQTPRHPTPPDSDLNEERISSRLNQQLRHRRAMHLGHSYYCSFVNAIV
jgi:hypothetical protein